MCSSSTSLFSFHGSPHRDVQLEVNGALPNSLQLARGLLLDGGQHGSVTPQQHASIKRAWYMHILVDVKHSLGVSAPATILLSHNIGCLLYARAQENHH